MIKLIIAASLLATGVLGGIKLSQKHSARIIFYKSLCAFNCDYAAEMRFSRKKLREIMGKKYTSKILNDFLCDNCARQAADSLNISALGAILNADEMNEVSEYFDLLGKTDSETQIGYTRAFGEMFARHADSCTETDGKTAMLYKKLGVVAGLIAFVIAV